MKKVISLVLAMSFVFASVFAANAASFSQSGATKTPTAISYRDFKRLVEPTKDKDGKEVPSVVEKVRGKKASIVNAVRYNGSNTTWIVRLSFGEAGDQCAADFVVTCYPYSRDPKTQTITSLPFTTVKEGTAIYGPCWYYFGLFDDIMHDSCGFAVCERIKRWPDWKDLSFSGSTKRGVYYSGSYAEGNDTAFIENHNN